MSYFHGAIVSVITLGLSACQTGAPLEPEAPALIVPEKAVLEGEAPSVQVTGLTPGQTISVTLERNRGRRELTLYRSSATFTANNDGHVDIFSTAPEVLPYGDSYRASDLFSSMQRSDDPAVEGRSTRVILVSVDLNTDGINDLTDAFRMQRGEPDLVTVEDVPGLTGAFLTLPKGDGPFPAIIFLGGSEGHDSSARDQAPRWASRGYAALGLPYYSPAWGDQPQRIPGLPKAFADIPIDKLETARKWLCTRNDIKCDRIGLWGVSKGAEMVLAGASRIDGFAAVAAIVPSDVIWEGWGAGGTVSSFSWRGEPLEFVPYEGMGEHFAKLGRGEESYIRTPHDQGRISNPGRVAPARIAVEAIDEPVFLVGGDDDKVWASGPMARTIEATRAAADLDTVAIISSEAGHFLSGHPYQPLQKPEALVRREAFPALVAFYEEHLKIP